MAETLKQIYDLVVLKVGLESAVQGRETCVRCEIQAKVEGRLQTLAELDLAPKDLGLSSRLSTGNEETSWSPDRSLGFRIPPDLEELLRSTLAHAELRKRPLWIQLVSPYGYLGIVPWETLLVPVLGIPVLRLPDVIIPPPVEVTSVLDVVLCSSSPLAETPHTAEAIGRMIERIVEAAARPRLQLHVFADTAVHSVLATRSWPQAVSIHDPRRRRMQSPAPSSSSTSRRPAGNPWLTWMCEALQGQSVDVIHFVCPGSVANERGALRVGASPSEGEDEVSRFIGSCELDAFVTQIGAWSCAFSTPRTGLSPPSRGSEIGLRLLGDTLAQLRPVSILLHDSWLDPGAEALRDAYSFLYAMGRSDAPISPALTLHCQPDRVMEPDEVQAQDPIGAHEIPMIRSSRVEDLEDDTGAIPNWAAAGERFMEQQRLGIKRAIALNPSIGQRAGVRTVSTTLEKMQSILARNAHPHKKERT